MPGSTLESRPSLFQVTRELTNNHVIFIGILPISGWIKSKSSNFTNHPLLFTCQVVLDKNDRKENESPIPYYQLPNLLHFPMSCYTFSDVTTVDMDPPKNLQPASWLVFAKNRTLRPIDQVDDFHALQPLDPEIYRRHEAISVKSWWVCWKGLLVYCTGIWKMFEEHIIFLTKSHEIILISTLKMMMFRFQPFFFHG